MNPEKIGKFICELRKEKNLSQYQLADMIPITRQGVSKWERGVTTPDPQTLIQLSEMFGVTIDELLRGERRESKTIEDLEEITLSILDQSNKKTKKIKRITRISVSIIIILLLTFLSYYFISTYNKIEVYKIAAVNDKFTITDGIYLTTREKYYMKLGKIKNKTNSEITNIKLYYKNGKKNIIIIEDKEVDNLTIMDTYGYGEKLTKKDIKELKDNLYLEITYGENEKELIKLRYTRDYNNDSLFSLKQEKIVENKEIITTPEPELKPVEEPKEEEKKEEVKPTIVETPKQETPKEEPPKEEPQEPEITTDQIISKLKETCIPDIDSYICEFGDTMLMYMESTNQIIAYKNFDIIIDYDITNDTGICSTSNCIEELKNIAKENLFK